MITVIPRKITATSVNGVAVANDGSITLPVDSAPTTNSTNLVTSGGVKTELDALSARIGNAENPAQVWTDVSFTIPTSSWSLSNNKYTATVQSSSILATSGVFVNYDDLDNAITPIIAEESTGQVAFTTETIPSGTITGTFRIIDSVNGIVPMERGGTGIAAASKDNLLTQLGAAKQSDMTTAQTDIQNLAALVGNIDTPAQTALEVPFSIAVSSWSGSGPYTATINSSSIVTNSIVLQPNITGGFNDLDPVWSWERNSNNSITFTVNSVPTNTISGTIPVVLSINGVVPLARGGTGATTAAAALTNLGAVNKAGDTMTGDLVLTNSDNYPSLLFRCWSDSTNKPSTMIQPYIGGDYAQLRLTQKINDASHWDVFRLPATTDVATSNRLYDIITSKTFNPSTVGIVEDGNTATHTISKGQYVIWKGVLYTANAAIASGTTLAASGGNKNLTAVSGGGLNAVKASVDSLNSNLATIEYFSVTLSESITDGMIRANNKSWYNPATGIVCIDIMLTSNSGLIPTSNKTVFTVPNKYKPSGTIDLGYAMVKPKDEADWGPVWIESVRIDANGDVKLGNYIYGSKETKFFALYAIYKI